VLLRVNPPMPLLGVETGQYIELDDLEGRRERAEAYLAGLATEMEAAGVRTERRVRRGDPVTEIVATARAEGVDLIAMTTHGRTGAARLLFGSVAEGVLRQAPMPVFLMRQTEAQVAQRRRDAMAGERM